MTDTPDTTAMGYDQTLVPEAMKVLPLSVGFAIEYLDGVMAVEQAEIRNQWINVRAHVITEAVRAHAVRAGTMPSEQQIARIIREVDDGGRYIHGMMPEAAARAIVLALLRGSSPESEGK